jgi:hypothetical protein
MRPAYRLRFAARRRLTFWLLRSHNETVRFAATAAAIQRLRFFER